MAEAQITTESIEQTLTVEPINPTANLSQQDMVHMVQYMAKAMQKNSHLQMLSRLSPDVRRRLRALRKLQLQTNNIEMEFHRKEFELEKEFQVKHSEILKKRFEIVSGEYEPKDEECDYPDPDLLQRIDENISLFTHINVSEAAEGGTTPIKGIPNFWLHILYSNPMLDFILHDGDEDILNHLIDIRTTYQSQPHYSFILEFEFSENPFFENSILTKEYFVKIKFDVLLYEGPEICKTVGCDIKWKKEKNPNEQPSFLDFFNPPVLPEVMDPSYEDIKNLLESDFQIGNYIKDHIIPKATLCYTGEFHDGCEECYSDSGAEDDLDDYVEDEKLDG